MTSLPLQNKLSSLLNRAPKVSLGEIHFQSPFVLAPMAAIGSAPFRLLMERLGAGATVSELISCHGILYKNKMTLDMLRVDPEEKSVGIQLFGDDGDEIAAAAQVAESYGPKWIDLNMGCPVKKVVTKGGGAALLQNVAGLEKIFTTIKRAIKIPFTIKIRTGWDLDSRNADEILRIAQGCGVEFVAIHGRTRNQQYTGLADWDYMDKCQAAVNIPVIGNGDLHSPRALHTTYKERNFSAYMVGRGALRNPFIFAEAWRDFSDDASLRDENIYSQFGGRDYWIIIQELKQIMEKYIDNQRVLQIQLKKFLAWFSTGFPHAVSFRTKVLNSQDYQDTLKMTEDYFLQLELHESKKRIEFSDSFMTSGHG
ncbi:MAG: tRNA-dihydrouridine synthase [Bacteriovoracaceae bacterium]|nr:tRNA-dihydrouridine synthase [Bacteriovoracaceae bacterium]